MNVCQTIHHSLLIVIEHPCSLFGARGLLDFHNERGTRLEFIDSLSARKTPPKDN